MEAFGHVYEKKNSGMYKQKYPMLEYVLLGFTGLLILTFKNHTPCGGHFFIRLITSFQNFSTVTSLNIFFLSYYL